VGESVDDAAHNHRESHPNDCPTAKKYSGTRKQVQPSAMPKNVGLKPSLARKTAQSVVIVTAILNRTRDGTMAPM
jgi:hypothetical protein